MEELESSRSLYLSKASKLRERGLAHAKGLAAATWYLENTLMWAWQLLSRDYAAHTSRPSGGSQHCVSPYHFESLSNVPIDSSFLHRWLMMAGF